MEIRFSPCAFYLLATMPEFVTSFPIFFFLFFLFFFIVGSGIAFLAVRHADPFLHVFITYLLTSGIL